MLSKLPPLLALWMVSPAIQAVEGYPGAVGIVATGDPKHPWAVEVAARLVEKSLDEVW